MLEAKQIADMLNQLFVIDPAVAESLVNHRVVCSDAFLSSEVPFVVSLSGHGDITMGIVGFMNAMALPGTGYAAAAYGDDNKLTGFTVVGSN